MAASKARKRAARNPGHGARRPQPSSGIAERLQAGLRHQMAGDLAAATAAYGAVLETEPRNPDALHLLGVVKLQAGRFAEAVDLIARAVRENPNNADYHGNLAAALLKAQRPEEAAEASRAALRLNPDNAGFHGNLAVALRRLGRPLAAVDSYRAALRLNPTAVHLLRSIGDLYLGEELYQEARDSYRAYLAQAFDDPEAHNAHNNLGHAEEKLGDLEAAEACYNQALAMRPDDPDYLNNVALMHRMRGRLDEAEAMLRRACVQAPDKWSTVSNLAGLCLDRGRHEEAVALLREQLDRYPDEAELWQKLGSAFVVMGRFEQAQETLLKAIELDPDDPESYRLLSGCFFTLDNPSGAYAALRKVLELNPRHPQAHLLICQCLYQMGRLDEANIRAHAAVTLDTYVPQNFVFPLKTFRYTCDFDGIDDLGDIWALSDQMPARMLPQAFLHMLVMADSPERNDHLVRLHRRWGAMIQERARLNPLPPLSAEPRGGKIRLGLLSSDLRSHSVAKFILPVLGNYDRDRFEIFCYAPMESKGDPIQEKIRGLVSRFAVLDNRPDGEFAAAIRADAVDILIDLNGITQYSRTPVLAYRPAPVQMQWLGYPYTCGMPEIDYAIVDRFTRPTRDELLVEKPLELPGVWACFGEMGQADIDPVPPCLKTGIVTFGTLNNPYKYTRAAIAAWAKVMSAVPGSRFLLVRWRDGSTLRCHHLVTEFAKHGISGDRLFFMPNAPGKHLDCYNEIDISLDTFPLTGGTTTCDALWMGVPIVSLRGEGFHQRLSHSYLNHAGLGDLSCGSEEAYVQTAVALAQNVERLQTLRRTLRPALLASELCRGDLFAASFQDTMAEVAQRHGLR